MLIFGGINEKGYVGSDVALLELGFFIIYF